VEELEEIAYTSRQLNSTSTSLQLFNLVVLCSLQQVESVKCAMLKCFDSVEVAYAYDKTAEVLPAGEALLTLWLERSISCESNLTSLLILGKHLIVYLLL